ncbi:hypothetical protein BUZ69_04395 [Staphylococcus saprophyticus]|uniref:hypothetical protein n=1 Tax=Staphylococcus saprophyticus TaxID=29385 RepID=UPI000D1F657C|nr:hypothetical protein [Staphylococcus saprophyticus]PTK47080.1 hypothetical protein BUZ69_04395 [Staphylococcus saprophyticus]
MKKRVKGRIIGLVLVVILSLLAIGIFIMNVNETHNEIDKAEKSKSNEDYQYFKENTTVIKGKVKERYIQNDNGQKERYLVVSYKDDSRKLVNVNEEQFHEYKQGSQVEFRIHRAKDNEVVADLRKDKDIKDKKDYKAFKKQNNKEIWQKMREPLET